MYLLIISVFVGVCIVPVGTQQVALSSIIKWKLTRMGLSNKLDKPHEPARGYNYNYKQDRIVFCVYNL
jgi:hypothetical protein